jgi:hypothetical protein
MRCLWYASISTSIGGAVRLLRAFLLVLSIFLGALGGTLVLDTFGRTSSDTGFRFFVGLVLVLSAAALYVRKLHRVSPMAPKQS